MNKLKIFLVTENDPIYVYEFFKEFYSINNFTKINICGVSILNAFNESLIKTFIRIFKFYGLPDFIKLLFKFLKKKTLNENIRKITKENNINLINTKSINSTFFLSQIKNLNPDIIISVSAPEIFKSRLLEIPKLCCLNIHSGKIPDYRGMMPTFWQMHDNKNYITITIHEMEKMLDAGGIVATKNITINKNDTLDRLMIESKKESAKLLTNILNKIIFSDKKLISTPIDLSKERLFKFPTKKDFKKFKKNGYSLI